MAAERLSMRTIKEVLRLKWEKKLSNKQIATSCNIARSTIRDYLERAQRAGLSWPLAPDLDDGRLEALLFPSAPEESPGKRGLPAMEYIRKELTRKRVTLRLLWLEYRAGQPGRISVQPVLRAVPSVERQARRQPSPNPPGRGKTLCRLCRPDDPGNGSGFRTDQRGAPVCRHPGRQQLHVCLGRFLRGSSLLDRGQCPGV